MLKKFIKIKNIGRFKDYDCAGDVELKKLNIVYGENGAGKTTLVVILRSLRENNKNILFGRKTLGATDEQQILISTESEGQIKFNNDGWAKNLSNIEVFDNTFVTQNVHSGNYIDIEHKRSLHLWAIGEDGVKLAIRIAGIDKESRELTLKIREVESNIKGNIKGEISVEEFILLDEKKDIENKIREQETILESSRNAKHIKEKQTLNLIDHPKIDVDSIREVLGRSYSDITEEIAIKVKEHITHDLDKDGESWIEQGFDYIKNESCPFCTQNLKDVEIIDYYKDYFNDAYKSYKKDIANRIQEIKRTISDSYIESIKSTIKLNEERLNDWNNIIHEETNLNKVDLENYEKEYEQLITKATELLGLKLNNPIEPIDLKDFESLNNNLVKYTEDLDEYNKIVTGINSSIEQFKNKLSGDPQEEQQKLDNLFNSKNRFSEDVVILIEKWQKYHEQKEKLTIEKDEKKDKLNKITVDVLNKYSEGINKYLYNCGANFQLHNSEVKYTGGKACLEYKIKLNDTSIALGKADSPDEIPSFKNTLSEGDKSALAFAFFLARIEKDADINKKVVVIDDPISSMDVHRKDTTAYALYKISQSAVQTLIFTHSPEFAKLIWDKDKTTNKKCLRTEIENGNCKIIEWDIDKIGMSDYFHHYFLLSEFVTYGRGDKKSIAQSIRPLLEGNLRHKFPQSFKNDQWLGNYIKLIRESDSSDNIHNLFDEPNELEEINEYSKKFHHDQDENWSENLSSINSTSLKAYSERALKFCTG